MCLRCVVAGALRPSHQGADNAPPSVTPSSRAPGPVGVAVPPHTHTPRTHRALSQPAVQGGTDAAWAALLPRAGRAEARGPLRALRADPTCGFCRRGLSLCPQPSRGGWGLPGPSPGCSPDGTCPWGAGWSHHVGLPLEGPARPACAPGRRAESTACSLGWQGACQTAAGGLSPWPLGPPTLEEPDTRAGWARGKATWRSLQGPECVHLSAHPLLSTETPSPCPAWRPGPWALQVALLGSRAPARPQGSRARAGASQLSPGAEVRLLRTLHTRTLSGGHRSCGGRAAPHSEGTCWLESCLGISG